MAGYLSCLPPTLPTVITRVTKACGMVANNNLSSFDPSTLARATSTRVRIIASVEFMSLGFLFTYPKQSLLQLLISARGRHTGISCGIKFFPFIAISKFSLFG